MDILEIVPAELEAMPIVLFLGPPEVDVAPPGHTATVSWAGVAGATEVEVAQAEATIGPALAVENVPSVPFDGSGAERVVTPPAGKRVRSLTLSGLKAADGTALPGSGDLSRDRRLVVSVPDGKGGWNPPQFAVPAVDGRGMIPASLTGASYDAGVLHLPDVSAARLRLNLTDGDFPEEFVLQEFQLAGVSGQLVSGPKDLTLVDPAGGVLWTFPDELPPGSPRVTVDLRLAVETAFETALGSGAPLDAAFTLRAAAAPARAGFAVGAVHGALLRVHDGAAAYEVEGGELPLSLGGPLADEAPSGATCDLRVRYRGLRLHETLRDPVPYGAGDVAGVVVGAEHVLRAFPPAAFEQLAPGRIGVIGRAPERCELSVTLVEVAGGATGRPLADPAVAAIDPGASVAVHWFELPELTPPLGATGVSVRATSGRFLWVAGESPAVRVAVRDPDPGGRALTLGGVSIASVTGADAFVAGVSLPTAPFSGVPPSLASDLFLTVELGSLTLRYAR